MHNFKSCYFVNLLCFSLSISPVFLMLGCGDLLSGSSASDTNAETTDDPTGPITGSIPDGCQAGECPATRDLTRDILLTDLNLDLSTHKATAKITIAASEESHGASFEVGDLTVQSVKLGNSDLLYIVNNRILDVGVPFSKDPLTLTVEYEFKDQTELHGWNPTLGVSYLWPSYCGELFPCHSNPQDGTKFVANVTGQPSSSFLVYPTEILTEIPSYVFGIAIGDYTYTPLNYTEAGTEVGLYYLSTQEANAKAGAQLLPGYFEFYENTYGPYEFGGKVATVGVDWQSDEFSGGIEHHPFWHIDQKALTIRDVHAHEAAHGWFGNGVRIHCWEDLILSEGLASYLAARAVEDVEGKAAADAVWALYQEDWDFSLQDGDTIALPDETCNEISILDHPLWLLSGISYSKTAFFMRELEMIIGRSELDAALATFYQDHVGTSMRMQDLLDHIQSETAFDPNPLANTWLRSLGVP